MFSLDFHEVSMTHESYIGLYKQVQCQALFDINKGRGVEPPPYLLGDKGYSLINWIMMPYKGNGHHTIRDFLYNKKT
jgi:hypothetical protein